MPSLLDFRYSAVSMADNTPYFLADGQEAASPNHMDRIHVVQNHPNNVTLRYRRGAVDLLTITDAQVVAFFNFVNQMGYHHGNYRNVKTLGVWRTVYNVQQMMFHKWDRVHGQMGQYEDATACRVCRVVVPLRMLSVDHQKAQQGGHGAAMMRVFRGLGLTDGAPHGNKNRDSLATNAAAVGGDPNAAGAGRQSRYTTNLAGAIYYSVLRNDDELLQVFLEACMHHYLNLRPVCGPCNSRLQNQNIF